VTPLILKEEKQAAIRRLFSLRIEDKLDKAGYRITLKPKP
jgi:hypothetical protein